MVKDANGLKKNAQPCFIAVPYAKTSTAPEEPLSLFGLAAKMFEVSTLYFKTKFAPFSLACFRMLSFALRLAKCSIFW